MTGVPLICFFALFCAVIGMILREQSPAFSALLQGAATIIFLIAFLQYITPVFSYIKSIYSLTGYGGYFAILMKALEISLLVCIVSQFCRDLGEAGIAGKVELCGKAALLYLSLPILQKLFEFIGEFTG